YTSTEQVGEKASFSSSWPRSLPLSLESRSETENELSFVGGLVMSWPRPDGIWAEVGPLPWPPQVASSGTPMSSGSTRIARNMAVSPCQWLDPNAGPAEKFARGGEVRMRVDGFTLPLPR